MIRCTDKLKLLEETTSKQLLQPSVLRAMETDENVPYAREGKLTVLFAKTTPLWVEVACEVAEDATLSDIIGGGATEDQRVVQSARGTRYVTRPSTEIVRWELRPLAEPEISCDSFCGFSTHLVSIKHPQSDP